MEQTITMSGDDRLTDQQLVQAEIDLRRDFASGYANNARAPVQLQKLFNELSAEQTTKRDQEESLERFVRESRAKTDKAQEDAQESIRTMSMEEWLESKHAFGNIELTGAQWQHVARYAREHEDQLIKNLMDKGYTKTEAETALRVTHIMGSPDASQEQKDWAKEQSTDKKVQGATGEIIEEAGVTPSLKQESQNNMAKSERNYTPDRFVTPSL